jgi:uncharacterized protein YyaL (SSP411 family)
MLPSVPAADPPKAGAKANKLATESSPYLLQHAYNPVDWLPWGPEAFARAKKEGKLVFLSIGYSSCHWCHVMERESFANEDIAKVLNEHFVCIKVDREERPDVDDVYMTALQTTGVNGGWPLTMFLTPDGKPIFGGTYFPPDDRKVGDDTAPGMKSVLKKVVELHRDKKKELYEQADRIAEMTNTELNRAARGVALVKLDEQLVKDAVGEFDLDPEHGGLGRKATGHRGTKFPRVSALLFLLHQSAKPGNEPLAKLLTLTLDRMAQGGIYDHLGGGFHRYSTERTWTVPHFEKMLYDQAQLVELYCEAYRQKPNPAYKRVIDETLAFVARELTAPEGYFYSALDADSDGEEGRFYVWTPQELDAALGTRKDAELFRTVYGVDKPNFEGKYHILRTAKFPTDDELAKLTPLKQKLFDLRAKRNRPFLDTKLITAWNGQMIAAYALAGQVLKEPKYVTIAETAAKFVLTNVRDGEGLARTFAAAPGQKPRWKGTGYLEDYASLTHGVWALYEATGDAFWSRWGQSLHRWQTAKFADPDGGYFNTPKDGEKLFARGKDSYDGAQPSANGVSLRNELRLWKTTGSEGDRQIFEKNLRRFAAQMKGEPTAVPMALATLDAALPLGALKDLPTRMAEKAKNPKDSSDVVSVTLSPLSLADGLESYAVGITVAKGWHVYANPVNNKDLAASATVVEFEIDGKPAKHQDFMYPKGTKHKDQSGGEYDIYEGQFGWTAWLAHDETANAKVVAVKVKVIACNDKTCLKPSTLKVEAK